MKAARIKNGVVADLWMVPSLDCYEGITLIAAPDNVGMGWAYDGINFIAPQRILSEVAKAKLTQLKAAYDKAIQQPVQFLSHTFQADTASQQVLTASLAPGAVPAGFAWLDSANVSVPMTFVQLQGLAGVMLAQGYTAFVRLQERKTAVRAAVTVEEVDAVVW
jgi:hypothetical protein